MSHNYIQCNTTINCYYSQGGNANANNNNSYSNQIAAENTAAYLRRVNPSGSSEYNPGYNPGNPNRVVVALGSGPFTVYGPTHQSNIRWA